MALQCKKINDKYMPIDLYYRIEGMDFTASNCLIVYVKGYSTDDDKVVLDSDKCFTFPLNKSEVISYELAYELLKTLPAFENSINV